MSKQTDRKEYFLGIKEVFYLPHLIVFIALRPFLNIYTTTASCTILYQQSVFTNH